MSDDVMYADNVMSGAMTASDAMSDDVMAGLKSGE